jgi:hypothetical protein
MADQYKSTQDQIDKELEAMHTEMRDPEKQDEKQLKVTHSENVKRTTVRYGLD